jgi:hemin uptake protein HemP
MSAVDDQEEQRNTSGERLPSAQQRPLTITDNRLDSRDLFVGTREIVIRHGSDSYHLRLTAQNKLILTK